MSDGSRQHGFVPSHWRDTVHYEVKRARHTYDDHDHVYCAACGEIVSGPHESTAQPKGQGAWARQCGACGVTTWYDIDDSQPYETYGESSK